jgi:predicted GH43/DUF377 family glycosyl hydrolase
MKFKRLLAVSIALLLISLLFAVPAVAQGEFDRELLPVLELDGGTTYDNNGVGGACVIYDSDTSLYKMWYTGVGDNGISICYAESNNGLAWNKPYTNPVIQGGSNPWDMTGVGGPSVLLDSSATYPYQIWYTGINGTTASIGWAQSFDGINWVDNALVMTGTAGTWDADSVAFPSVLFDEGIYKMWYTGQDKSQGASMMYELAIGYAYSDDGQAWTKAADPVLTKTAASWDNRGVGACSVIKAGSNSFKMYYTGFELTGSHLSEIGEALCNDNIGLDWTKTGLVLEAGGNGAWDFRGVAAPSVLMINGITKMWYTGADMTSPFPVFAIGYAEHEPEAVPATSNLSTGLMIGGFAVLMFVAYWGVRRYQLQNR